MCMPSTPDIKDTAPTPTIEEAKTDDTANARKKERKRLSGAVNSRTSILSGTDSSGRKTLLGM